jgi:hypothetical protein
MPDQSRAWKIVVRAIRPAALACLLVAASIGPALADYGQPNSSPAPRGGMPPAVSCPPAGVEFARYDEAERDDFRAFCDAVWNEEGNRPSLVQYATFLSESDDAVRPPVLRAPIEQPESPPPEIGPPQPLFRQPIDPPLGYTGNSSVLPAEQQTTSDFVPMEDRWRFGFSAWDRYDHGHPPVDDYPYVDGHWWDPYNQNVLKGDYPIIGQHTFLEITASTELLLEARQVPTPATGYESTANPFQTNLIGNGSQFFYTQFFRLGFDLSHGDTAFKPTDWRVHLMPVFDVNYLTVSELGIVSPNVNDGLSRGRNYFALQEWFLEDKLDDTSPYYDFMSVRVGAQPFVSDFRGFIFNDTNRAVRLFGTRLSNRDQFNVLFFDQLEKDTDSGLNTFDDRGQYVFIMNYYRQDFLVPGYTAQVSFHYDHDKATVHFDDNGFLVRPDPSGIFQPHEINAFYFGFAGDGHIGPVNVNNACYYVCGHDDANPLAGRPVQISAGMAALELSYDRDWVRFRASALYASGDHNISSGAATGFDSILDEPNFAGGKFSYWDRQQIGLLGVNLVNRLSLLPDLRASKDEGQANFVNPGLELLNYGMDFEVTQKLRLISNVNFLWFDSTNVLEQFVYQDKIHRHIGTDLSLGAEYRPWLNNNCIIDGGIAGLIPGQGFHDIYDNIDGGVSTQIAGFVDVTLTY